MLKISTKEILLFATTSSLSIWVGLIDFKVTFSALEHFSASGSCHLKDAKTEVSRYNSLN